MFFLFPWRFPQPLRSRAGCWSRKKETRVWPSSIPRPAKVIASVLEGGVTGHEVIASPDGRLAYVPIYGNSGVGKPGTDGSNLVVIDIASQKVVGTRRLRPRRAAAHARSSGPKTACST